MRMLVLRSIFFGLFSCKKNSNDADMGSIEEKKSDLDGTYENRLGSRSNSFISIG